MYLYSVDLANIASYRHCIEISFLSYYAMLFQVLQNRLCGFSGAAILNKFS
jgi:hypothetical protein